MTCRAIASSLVVAAAVRAGAQGPLVPLDYPEQREVITELTRQLHAQYVFPEVGNRMIGALERNFAAGTYSRIDRSTFAERLTVDLQAISHDKHLRVRYSLQPLPATRNVDEPDSAQLAIRRASHFGFSETEMLPGNVALLVLRGFEPAAAETRDTAIAAMKRLGGADALLIDLRSNGGGDPNMVALVSSMLWPRGQKVHLNDLYFRPANQTDQFWTNADLDVPRITGPVFTVTSSYTFSAAEEFTYNLKQLKRATQVGQTTGGGANPGGSARLSDHFVAFVPSGRAVNPITKTNWEGVGNIPEIATSRESALTRAYDEALKRLQLSATSEVKRKELQLARAKLANGEITLP